MCRQKKVRAALRLAGVCLLLHFLPALPARGAGAFLSFQEGNLRMGTNFGAGTNGNLLSSSYTVGGTVLRSDLPGSNQQGRQLLAGNNGTATNRILLAFDLSYLTNLVGTNFVRVDTAALVLSHETNSGSGSGSIQAVYQTSAFDEDTATWSQPGNSAPAGGLAGTALRERSVIGTSLSPDQEVWGSPDEFWGANTGAGPDLLVEAVRQALTNSSRTLHLLVRRKTEQENSYYSRYVHDEDARVNFRPQLLAGVDAFGPMLELTNYPILSFKDDFNGGSLDTSRWTVGTLDPARTNVGVSNGCLVLTTRQEGANWREGLLETSLYACKYGYYEARMKLNGASGLNNAFWLNAPYQVQVADNIFDRTEIDITEAHHAHNDSHMTVHDWAPAHFAPYSATAGLPNISEDFHTVGLDWKTDNSLVFYWDGVPRGYVSPSTFLGIKTLMPLAVLFSTKVIVWAGEPGAGLDGSQMLVDYVQVRQKQGWSGAASGNWADAANWGVDGIPGPGRAAVFNAPVARTTVSMGADILCHSLYFDNVDCPSFTVAAGPGKLHLGAAEAGIGGVIVNTPVTNSQALNVDLVAERELQFGNFSRSSGTLLRFNGDIDAPTGGTPIQLCGFSPIELNGSLSTNIGRIVKWGSNTAQLAGTNLHLGTTEVYKGTLVVASPGALGQSGPGAETIVTNGGSLLFAPNLSYSAPEVLRLAGAGASGSGGVIDLEAVGQASFAGPVILDADVTLACSPVNGTLTLGGPISGPWKLSKAGGGTLEMTGSNTFTGQFTVSAGAVVVRGNFALGSTGAGTLVANTGQLRLAGNVSVPETVQVQGGTSSVKQILNAGGTNTLSGEVQLLGGGYEYGISSESGKLIIAGSIGFTESYGSGRTCLLAGAGSGVISGVISNGVSAVVSVSKAGSGDWTLEGANVYTGPTVINDGTFLLNGSSKSALTLNNGTFGGSGVVSNQVSILGGAHVPGGPLGAQTIYGSYQLGAPGKLKFNIKAELPAFSRLLVRGGNTSTVSLAGGLQLAAPPNLETNSSFTLIDNDGTDAVIGVFAGLPNNSSFPAGGYLWRIKYVGGDGNDVTVTVLSRSKPSLSTTRAGNQVIVAWPEWGGAYQLRASTNLAASGGWFPVTNTAVASNGTLNLFLPLAWPACFFRLEYP